MVLNGLQLIKTALHILILSLDKLIEFKPWIRINLCSDTNTRDYDKM